MPQIRTICQPELGWDDPRWEAEEEDYLDLWRTCYSLPERASIPDWQAMLAQANAEREATWPIRRRKVVRRSALAGGLACLALMMALLYWLSRRAEPKGRSEP